MSDYTIEQVREAINRGADLVLENLSLGEPEEDAINLVVNAAISSLEDPTVDIERVAQEQYQVPFSEIATWWSWS
ncbi:hypothetical protein [Streptomyces sp. ISL-11]|uniref:hypothetical protein n=1 Tax=Streptomyces sp. ISL-11 TaxID=2819174 RepID=UPI001BE6CCAB|nr:hypothetical protein [Streptomyces sp. ISL-11]MBT2383846.1 hypothetical protein [Streptomyces sp. ISL-11]